MWPPGSHKQGYACQCIICPQLVVHHSACLPPVTPQPRLQQPSCCCLHRHGTKHELLTVLVPPMHSIFRCPILQGTRLAYALLPTLFLLLLLLASLLLAPPRHLAWGMGAAQHTPSPLQHSAQHHHAMHTSLSTAPVWCSRRDQPDAQRHDTMMASPPSAPSTSTARWARRRGQGPRAPATPTPTRLACSLPPDSNHNAEHNTLLSSTPSPSNHTLSPWKQAQHT